MGLIVNPRGTGGSGKTELVRRIMAAYGWTRGRYAGTDGAVEPILRAGRPHPLGYRLRHPAGGRPLAVLGHYERTSGGCDTIGAKDGGLAEVFRLAADHAEAGCDVLIEGLALSGEWQGSAALARAYPLHVLHLTTPPETAARLLARRRREAARNLPRLRDGAAAQGERVAAACELLRPCARVHRLGFDEALAKARALLRLEGDGRPETVVCQQEAPGSGWRASPADAGAMVGGRGGDR